MTNCSKHAAPPTPRWQPAERLVANGRVLARIIATALICVLATAVFLGDAQAQFGGGGFGGGGAGGGPNMPGPDTKPKFSDHVYSQAGLAMRREKGDAVVLGVKIVGNRNISSHQILQQLHTRQGRFFDNETVLGDVRRLNDMGSFETVRFDTKEYPKQKGVVVTFMVRERAVVKQVVYHGARGMGVRELSGRAGINVNDPLSKFTIESARRRLIDYYHEEGFNQAAVTTTVGYEGNPGAVVFRINEGPLERIRSISVEGNTILSEARLEKIIKSRGPVAGVLRHFGNVANMEKINRDVDVLAATYHNLGYLTATVGRRLEYEENGKWLHVTFVVNEGPRFKINNVQIEGNQFVTEASLRQRIKLKPGDMFDGTQMRKDVGEMTYGYGELGFLYAEITPRTVMRDESNVVDLVYKIEEGDRWVIDRIRVNIEGEPHLMRESTMLNLIDGLREGDFIDRRKLEIGKRRLSNSNLLETNPQVAGPPDIIVQPKDDEP